MTICDEWNGVGWGDAMNVKHNTTGGIEGQRREGGNERMRKGGKDRRKGWMKVEERRRERMSQCVCAAWGCCA